MDGPTVVELLGDPAAWVRQAHDNKEATWIGESHTWEQLDFDLER